MAIQPHEEIIDKLNNPYGYAPAKPKAADDFFDFVTKLLEEANPKGNMLTDAAAYYDDPFRLQNAKDKTNLDEELARKKKEEEAAKAATGGGGMFGSNNTPYDSGSGEVQLTKEQLEWLGRETLDERANRLKDDWFGLKPIGAYLGGGMLGLGNYSGSRAPTLNDLMYQQDMYNKTPAALRWMLPDSYQKANERISEYNRIMNGVTPYEDITPIFDIPGVSDIVTPYEDITPIFDIPGVSDSGGGGTTYSPSSDGYSATGDGTGNYSAPSMSDPYGGVI